MLLTAVAAMFFKASAKRGLMHEQVHRVKSIGGKLLKVRQTWRADCFFYLSNASTSHLLVARVNYMSCAHS